MYLLSWFCVESVLGVSLDVLTWDGSGDTGDSLGWGTLLIGQLLERRRLFTLGIGIVGISSGMSGNSFVPNPNESADSISTHIQF